jgi:hypothetical protein
MENQITNSFALGAGHRLPANLLGAALEISDARHCLEPEATERKHLACAQRWRAFLL